jgi:hypothetical protein
MSTLSLKALAIAKRQLGVQEIPKLSNWGPDVSKYIKSAGGTGPEPWCMAFVYWCVAQAAKELNLPNPLYQTASVHEQWNQRPKLRVNLPQPGDIGILLFTPTEGHAFLVDGVMGQEVSTIEGNSNTDGSRDGYEVVQKPGGRLISHIHGFLRV